MVVSGELEELFEVYRMCLPIYLLNFTARGAYKSDIVVLGRCNLIKLSEIRKACPSLAFLKSLRKQSRCT